MDSLTFGLTQTSPHSSQVRQLYLKLRPAVPAEVRCVKPPSSIARETVHPTLASIPSHKLPRALTTPERTPLPLLQLTGQRTNALPKTATLIASDEEGRRSERAGADNRRSRQPWGHGQHTFAAWQPALISNSRHAHAQSRPGTARDRIVVGAGPSVAALPDTSTWQTRVVLRINPTTARSSKKPLSQRVEIATLTRALPSHLPVPPSRSTHGPANPRFWPRPLALFPLIGRPNLSRTPPVWAQIT